MSQPYPSAPQQPQSAPKKSRRWPWVFLGVIVAVVAIAIGTNGGGETGSGPTGVAAGNENQAAAVEPVEQKPSQHTVVYAVTGSGTASSITYTTDGMTTTNQESNVALPWKKTIKLPTDEAFQMVQLMAQGDGAGEVNLEIRVDGKLVKEAHADGYGMAMADAEIGTLNN